jgi:arylsulfatase
MYHDGWFARVIHRAPWERAPRRTLAEDIWELYDMTKDFSLTEDVAKENPAKLKELQELFLKEARVNHVLPLDDRSFERLNPAVAGRPDLMAGRTSLTLQSGMGSLGENAFINTKNRSFNIAADVELAARAKGAILAQGGRFGGYSLYLKDGKPTFTYNFLGLTRTTIGSTKALGAGKAKIRFEFAYDGGGPGKGGKATLFVNGKQEATGHVERTEPGVYSLDETADVGRDPATPVVEDYGVDLGTLTGKVNQVTVEVGPIGSGS